jgi:5'-3' exonuclease
MDSTDNIKGIPGTGEVKATKLLADALPENYATVAYNAYLSYYTAPGQALYEYQKNFRQVYLLRTDDDFQNEVGYIPNLQPPIEIIN